MRNNGGRAAGVVTGALLVATAAALAAGCGGGFGFGGGSRACRAGTFEPSYAGRVNLDRWRRVPVRVYFDGDFKHEGSDLRPLIRDGFDRWSDATGGRIGYTEVRSRSQADVSVRLERLNEPEYDAVGITTASVGSGRVYGARITLRVWYSMQVGEVEQITTTAAHEFGHALGIDGHSGDGRDLMYSRPSRGTLPTTRDVNTIRTAYCGLFNQEGGGDAATRATGTPCAGPCADDEGNDAADAVLRTHVCGSPAAR